MKKFILALLVLASTAMASATEETVLKETLPATRGQVAVDARFHIDTDMNEAFADISVKDLVTVYVHDCTGGPYRGTGRPLPHPSPYCRTFAQTNVYTVMSTKVKIEKVTMNGNEVIYQGAEGDVVCGTMGRSRVLRVPTFYLSGNCTLEGEVVSENGKNVAVVKFKTK